MRARVKSWIGNLALVAAATLVGLLLAEGALRVTGHRLIFPQMFVEDPHTVFRLKPGANVRTINAGFFDYEYTVNDRGLRSSGDVTVPSASGGSRKRVLFVGDSFTFGVGVNDSETYPARVGARLRDWCDFPVETLNAGVGGFGTSHELSFLQHYGWRFDPDVVVVGFLTSDPEDNSLNGLHRMVGDRLVEIPASERPGWGLIQAHKHVPGYTWLVAHSTLFNWTRQRIGNLVAQRAAAREARGVPTQSVEPARDEEREAARWNLTAAIFDRIRAQADSHDVQLVVAIIPHGGTLGNYYAAGRDADVDRMLEICREQQLTCVNVAESMRRARPTAAPASLYLREGHFNATGYDLVGDAVARRLAEELRCRSAS